LRTPDAIAIIRGTQTRQLALTPRNQRRIDRERFARSHRAEQGYAARLRAVARQVGEIVRGFAPTGTIEDFVRLRDTLYRYAELITPWARAVANTMLVDVARRDESAWREHGDRIGRALAKEIRYAPTGEILRSYLTENVDLITSLPREAAQRVHKLTIQGISGGVRSEQVAEEIMRTGKVTASRANLIARTEVARTASGLTMARAKSVGSEFFIWRTALDGDVRPLHKRLEGKAFRWDDPPVAGENGERAIAGAIYNCRCYPEPVLPDQI
jgi:SPP1 gp7 family putative phage head morphogenesis protein